jgi:hypothetical protein
MADYAMFSYNPMHYRSRVAVAEHGFASVTRGLLEYFDFFEQILSRHRIRISRKRVSQELAEITTHPEDTKRAEEILFHPEASFSV